MRSAALLVAMIASAAGAQVAPKVPITVTGHQWAPFISPMGEPFRARSMTDDTLADWFAKADLNHDGLLTAQELVIDAERFFSTLDTDHDGQIDPDELAKYEYDIAPDIQVMSKTRRPPGKPAPAARRDPRREEDEAPDVLSKDRRRERADEVDSSLGIGGSLQGAARYGLLNMPEPVAAADIDFDRVITLQEFKAAAFARFQLLDRTHQGSLTLAQLEALRPVLPGDGHRPKRKPQMPDARLGNPLPPGK